MATPNHKSVIVAWLLDFALSSKNLVSTGKNLMSYGIPIGYTNHVTGKKTLIRYYGDWTISPSTSLHVKEAEKIIKHGAKNVAIKAKGHDILKISEFDGCVGSYEPAIFENAIPSVFDGYRLKYLQHVQEYGVMENFKYRKE